MKNNLKLVVDNTKKDKIIELTEDQVIEDPRFKDIDDYLENKISIHELIQTLSNEAHSKLFKFLNSI